MSPFRNPFLGGTSKTPGESGTSMIRDAMKSSNYREALEGWRIAADGSAEFQDLSIPRVLTAGAANVGSLTVHGDPIERYFDDRPKAIVLGYDNSSAAASGIGTAWVPIMTFGFQTLPDMNYRVSVKGFHVWGTANNWRAALRMRVSENGSTWFTVDSDITYGATSGGVITSGELYAEGFFPTGNLDVVIEMRSMDSGYTVQYSQFSGDQQFAKPARFSVDEITPFGVTQPVMTRGAITVPPPPPKPVVQYKKTWYRDGWQTFNGNGQSRGGSNNAYAYQGYDKWYPSNGDVRAMFRFPHAAIRAELVGATILKSFVWLDNAHFYSSQGGIAKIGTHNNDTIPSVWGNVRERRWDLYIPKGGDGWTPNLGTDLGNEFKFANTRGLIVGPTFTGVNDYGYFNNAAIQLIYTK